MYNLVECTTHWPHSSDVSADKLLVHCVMGRSRSATLFLAYLMICEDMKVGEAIEHVKKCRRIIPNWGFLKQLRELDMQLLERRNSAEQSWHDSQRDCGGTSKQHEDFVSLPSYASSVVVIFCLAQSLRFLLENIKLHFENTDAHKTATNQRPTWDCLEMCSSWTGLKFTTAAFSNCSATDFDLEPENQRWTKYTNYVLESIDTLCKILLQ